MRLFERPWFARGLVLLAVLANAWVLAPEIELARVDLNDSVFHLTVIDRMADRLGRAESILDFWVPEWSAGYPVPRTYQPLGHWLVASLHVATGEAFPLDLLFSFVRWLLLALFPLSAYGACRLMDLPRSTSAATALLAPLLASPNLFGLEYGSYVWAGHGLYTQLLAMHLFVWTIGAGCRAIRRGSVTLAAALVALTLLTHFIYGYMAAATILLVALLPHAAVPLPRRLVRLTWIGLVSLGLAAFQILPVLADGPLVHRSRWEPAWKWDSFGLQRVLELVATGELLDSQRLPILSLLALAGAIAIIRRRESGETLLVLAGAILWLFLFCGRAAWGPLFNVLGAGEQAHLHRFIGGAHWFLLVLAGIGLTRVWTLPERRGWRYPAFFAIALTAALLVFPISERLTYLRQGRAWGAENLAAFATHRADIDQVVAAARVRRGRAYPGLAAGWGNQFRVGYVPFHAFLSVGHVPAVAFLYHSMSLPSDLMVRFDETRPDHYRLFDIRTAISETNRALPPFLRPRATFGAFRMLDAPGSGAFELVSVPLSVYADRHNFYDVSDAWLQSGWPAAGAHLLIDFETTDATPSTPRLPALASLAQAPPRAVCGTIARQSDRTAIVDAAADCYLLFKSTYHPNWRARIDGHDAQTAMLTPGFLGVRVPPGRHTVELRYVHEWWKTALLVLAFPVLIASILANRRGLRERLEAHADRWQFRGSVHVLVLALLVLPLAAPFFSGREPGGHDALQYLPRLVEFHENVRHGILLPRWAPDFSSGQGQPLFLLNPPLFYWTAELWHLLGLPFVAAINAASITLIAASAASMFLLGRWLYGPRGGLLTAAAYLYGAYFLVDLFVRNALAELTTFPFYPLIVYGLLRHARERQRRHLLLAGLAYSALWFAHTPAAVLFSPFAGALIVFLAWRERRWTIVPLQGAALTLGLLLAATVWMPAVFESKETTAERLTAGPLAYTQHFVFPRQFFFGKWGYGLSQQGPDDGMPFHLGWPQLLLAAIATVVVVRTAREGDEWARWLLFLAYATFAVCFLMTPRSQFVWEAIPQLHYVAFPWRLLATATFTLALIAGAAVLVLPKLAPRWQTPVYIAFVAAIVLAGIGHARPESYLSLDPAEWTPEQIAMRGAVASTFESFEPRTVQERPVYTGPRVHVTSGTATATTTARTPTRFTAAVRATSEAEVELPIALFPGWRVRIDGAETAMNPPSPSGRIRVAVPAGTHTVEARFGATPVRTTGNVLSAIALALFAALGFGEVRYQLTRSRVWRQR